MKTLLALAVSLTLLAGIAAPKAKAPTPQEKFDEAVLRAYEETKDDTAAFRARLEALRPLADAEGPSGEAKLDADRRFFDRLRQSSRRLLNTLRDRRAKTPTDTIVALTMDMLQPEERVDYEVRYDGDLPQSAEGAARSDVFERLPKENRLGGSGVYRPSVADAAAAHGHPRQLKRLRSAPPFRLAADEPGYERNFAAACDGRGLHLYLRCRDPEAWKTAEGLKDEFGFDISVQPGELEAERFFSGTFAAPAAFRGIEWDAPHPGYRLAMDALKVDAFAGKDAYFVHALMPWTGATRALPTDGTRWYALASAYAHKGSGRIGGASVHEFGHGAHLTFRLSDEDVRKVRLGALRAAAGDYLRARAKWESADFWDDPHLGDRAFYAEVVKPLTAELDASAKAFCANEGELSSEEVAKLVRTRFAAWAEFEMNVERARAAYLLKSQDFFGQGE